MLWLSMANPDTVRLRHMRDAATAALEMAGVHNRADVSGNLMLAMALTRCLEILRGAASKVSHISHDSVLEDGLNA